MACACISIYLPEKLRYSFSPILKRYQEIVIEDTCWFSIELEWHKKPTYTDYEKEQLTKVFGCFPKQDINIFGETDRIFVAVYELIKYFGGLLIVNLGDTRKLKNSYPGVKIGIYKKKYSNQSRHKPDYWLVDDIFIRSYFNKEGESNYEKFQLEPVIAESRKGNID